MAYTPEPGAEPAIISQRREVLLKCFQKLDLDGSGFIELHELRALAKQLTPQQNLEDALDMLRFLDKNNDRKVSEEEFLTVMEAVTEPMSHEEVEAHVAAMLGEHPDEAFNQPGYHHPAGCREYLQGEVVDVLREGLLALVDAAQASRLSVASGAEWELGPEGAEGPVSCRAGGEDGQPYRPRGWQPFNPLRWLGEWLLARVPADGEGAESSPPAPTRSFEELSRQEKVGLAFRYLDRDSSGFLDAHELLVVAGKLRKEQDMVHAQDLLNSMDLDQNGSVDLQEYTEFVMQLTEVLTDAEFDAAIHKVLNAQHLSLCTSRHDKFRFLFHELDQDRSGHLGIEELMVLAKRIDPDATPWKIQATLDFLDRDHTGTVDVEEFVTAMDKLTFHVKDSHLLDNLIASMLEGRKTGNLALAVDPLDEVEPFKLQELCRMLPALEHVLQASCSDVMDSVGGESTAVPLLLVDVRGEEEMAVSAIPGALHLPATEDKTQPHGWALANLEPLRLRLQESLLRSGGVAPRVVAYCNTGQRSGPASIWLSERLGMPVRCLCGGLINYYNQGGRVRDIQGREVQAIHPGAAELRQYITRPNNFKL